jgi:hypothetical protein
MKIIVVVGGEYKGDEFWDEEITGICPFCCSYSDCNYLEYYDYVSDYPMFSCNDCGAEAIIDIQCEKFDDFDKKYYLGTFNEVCKKYPEYSPLTIDDDPVGYFEYELLKIERISNDPLARYYSPMVLPQDKVTHFINSKYDKKLQQELGLEKRVYDGDLPESLPPETVFGEHHLSCVCNSYNIEEPKVPYPDNFDTDHDGVYMYAQVSDSNGNKKCTCYWGD